MKPFIVPGMAFNGHSRSSGMSSFVRSPGLSIRLRDRKRRLGYSYFETKTAEAAQFSGPHNYM